MNSAEKKSGVDELRPPFSRVAAGRASDAVRAVLWLALLASLPCGLALAQQSSQQTDTGQLSSHPLRSAAESMDVNANESVRDPAHQQRQLRQLNAAKYKSIVSNTDKLLKMVTELNAEIGNTNPASLTPDQLRKVAAIEKLARSVKDEMRTPVQTAPGFIPAQPLSSNPYQR